MKAIMHERPRTYASATPPPESQQPLPRRRSARYYYIASSATWAAIAALTLLVVGAIAAVLVYVYYARHVPSPQDLTARSALFKSTRIYDRNGELLYEVIDPTGGRRTIVRYDDLSDEIIWATVDTEDATFFRNPGFNPFAIARSVYWALTEGEVVSGASGITQQVARMLYLNQEQTLDRKLKEAVLATEITRLYSKEEILQIYLNEIYYGNLSYGIAAAAETYFGKRVQDLTLAESALLAGLPQAAGPHDPYTNPEGAKARRAVVLNLMARQGHISQQAADLAAQEPLNLRPLTIEIKAPHFVMYVRGLLEERYGNQIYRRGLQVYTTLDLEMQRDAERVAQQHIESLKGHNVSNAAVLTVNAHTGEILAMLGSVNFFDDSIQGQVNVTLRPRQPGSTVKPLAYAAAFERGWSPSTMLMDVRTEYPGGPDGPYVPANYDKKEHGAVSLRQALGSSYNIPAVQALNELGVPAMLEMAERLGITTWTRPDYGLSLVLGTADTTMIELVSAFTALANAGVRVTPNPILRVVDFEGNTLEDIASQPSGEQVLDARIAFLITSILSDNEARAPALGRQNNLVLSKPSAAKTGTTEDFRDAWVVGYTPDLVTGIWVGNSDGTPMENLPGVRGAGPIWQNYMEEILADQPAHDFQMPPGIVSLPVCPISGHPVTEDCPPARTDLFLEEAAPQGPCPVHTRIGICRLSGQRATELCPADLVDVQAFTAFPLAYRQWAEAQGYPQPPVDICPIHNQGNKVQITSPAEGQTVGGLVEIRGSAIIDELVHYILEYGISHDPGGWGLVRSATTVRVDGGTLGFWDTRELENGPHTIRVLAVNSHGQTVEARVHLYVFNGGRELTPTRWTTVTPTLSPTATFTWAPTQSPTASPTFSPTLLPSVTATATPPATVTAPPTASPMPSSTATQSPTAAPTLGPTLVQLPTSAPTPTATDTPPPTQTPAPTRTPAFGPTLVFPPTATRTPRP